MKKGILILPALFIIVVSLTIVVSSSIDYFHTNNYTYSSNKPIGNASQGEVGENFNKVKEKKEVQPKDEKEKENKKYKDIEIIISDKKLRSINNSNINQSELTKKINNNNDNEIQNKKNNNDCTYKENIDFSASKVIIKDVDNKNICNTENEIEMYLKNDEIEDKPVFKVKTSQIMGSLTIAEQLKIFKLAKKLNSQDYNKAVEYLKAKDQEQGILNALYLIKEKLSDEDYEKIRVIAERFINMDVVEEKGR